MDRTARKRLAMGAGLLVVIATIAVLKAPKSLEWHAHRVLDCVAAKNSGCIAGYARESELKALGIDRATFAKMLREEFLPEITGSEPPSRARLNELDAGQLYVQEMLTMRDGSKVSLVVTVAKTEEGIKFPYAVAAFSSVSMMSKYYEDKYRVRGVNKLIVLAKGSTHDGPALKERYGLAGALRNDAEGVITWDQYADMFISRLPEDVKRAEFPGK